MLMWMIVVLNLIQIILKVKNSGITNDMLNGGISNNKLENNAITIGNTELSLGSTSTME